MFRKNIFDTSFFKFFRSQPTIEDALYNALMKDFKEKYYILNAFNDDKGDNKKYHRMTIIIKKHNDPDLTYTVNITTDKQNHYASATVDISCTGVGERVIDISNYARAFLINIFSQIDDFKLGSDTNVQGDYATSFYFHKNAPNLIMCVKKHLHDPSFNTVTAGIRDTMDSGSYYIFVRSRKLYKEIVKKNTHSAATAEKISAQLLNKMV